MLQTHQPTHQEAVLVGSSGQPRGGPVGSWSLPKCGVWAPQLLLFWLSRTQSRTYRRPIQLLGPPGPLFGAEWSAILSNAEHGVTSTVVCVCTQAGPRLSLEMGRLEPRPPLQRREVVAQFRGEQLGFKTTSGVTNPPYGKGCDSLQQVAAWKETPSSVLWALGITGPTTYIHPSTQPIVTDVFVRLSTNIGQFICP